MARKVIGPTGSRRRRWLFLCTTIAALAVAAFFIVGAGATIGASNFEGNDGNLVVNTSGHHDWDNAPNLHVGQDLPTGTGDNSFGQGAKEDNVNTTVVSGSIPNSKADLGRFAVSSEIIGGDTYMYLAWARENQSGTVNFDFELNQAAQPDLTTPGAKVLNRTAGDLLINYAFSGGSNTPTLTKYHWGTSSWVSDGTIASGCSEGATNSVTISENLGGLTPVSRPAQQFGEAAINMTCAGIIPSGSCESFSDIYVKSRSSTSFTSEIKDFIAPIPVNLSNCGEIIIKKHTDPRGVNQSFGYTTTSPSGSGYPASFNLNDTGNSAGGDSAGNTNDVPKLQPGSYSVTEGANPNGFSFGSLSCTGGGANTSTSGKVATIGLDANEIVTCTYVNHQNTDSMVTQESTSGTAVPPGTAVHDTATVTGDANDGSTPSGNVEFFLCGPLASGTGCASGGADEGSGALSGSGITASADSPNVNTGAGLAPGFYCFRAEWGGDTHYPAVTHDGATNECFHVLQIGTTTVTTPSPGHGGNVAFGSSVTDTALVSALASGDDYPSGTVSFSVCDPSQTTGGACPTGGSAVGSAVTLVPTDPQSTPPSASATSAAITANKTGTWCFRAVYTPGPPNGAFYTGSSDASSGECFTVTDSTGSTSQQNWLPNDSGTVAAANGAPLNGTLSVQLYTGGTCQAGHEVSGQLYTKTLSGATSLADRTVTSNNQTFKVSASASVSWLVKFVSTDSNVSGSSHCESSDLTITN
ncbi:MAG: hypothetical protein ACJ75G_08340 [Gaiellaceae bacterium]